MHSSRRVIHLFGVLVAVATAGLLLGAADSAQVGEFGLDLAAMDRSVAPGDDFFRYVNGTWLTNTQIPADVARFNEFARLTDVNANRNRSILEKAAANPTTPEEKKVAISTPA